MDSGTTLTYLNNAAYLAVVQVTLNPNPKPWCMDHMVSLVWYVCVCVYQCWVLLEFYGSGSKKLN
jgi:hypothetical protein